MLFSFTLSATVINLKNDLDGKIRVTVGNFDNFLLNPAVSLMNP